MSTNSSFLCAIQLGSLTTLIKIIVMPQAIDEEVLGDNWLQIFGTTITCGDKTTTYIAKSQVDNTMLCCYTMKSIQTNTREDINEFRDGLEHNRNDKSRLRSGSIVENNAYEKSDVPNRSPNIMNIGSAHTIKRNPIGYISE